eukprot:gene7501-11824_t
MIDEESFVYLLNNYEREFKNEQKHDKTTKNIQEVENKKEVDFEESRMLLEKFLSNQKPKFKKKNENSKKKKELTALEEILEENPEILQNYDERLKSKIIDNLENNSDLRKLKELIYEKYSNFY